LEPYPFAPGPKPARLPARSSDSSSDPIAFLTSNRPCSTRSPSKQPVQCAVTSRPQASPATRRRRPSLSPLWPSEDRVAILKL
jgi:hypothetical protein